MATKKHSPIAPTIDPVSGVSRADMERAARILEQIAQFAEGLHNDAVQLVEELGDSAGLHRALNMRGNAERVGWLADLALEKLGEMQVRGGAEEWMMTPAYRALAEESGHV